MCVRIPIYEKLLILHFSFPLFVCGAHSLQSVRSWTSVISDFSIKNAPAWAFLGACILGAPICYIWGFRLPSLSCSGKCQEIPCLWAFPSLLEVFVIVQEQLLQALSPELPIRCCTWARPCCLCELSLPSLLLSNPGVRLRGSCLPCTGKNRLRDLLANPAAPSTLGKREQLREVGRSDKSMGIAHPLYQSLILFVSKPQPPSNPSFL